MRQNKQTTTDNNTDVGGQSGEDDTAMEDALLRALPPAWRQALQRALGSSPCAAAVAALHALSALLALSLGLLSFDGSLFGWHPLGMALGYQFFMAEGILTALALRPVTGGTDRVRGITAHAQAQLRAVGCVAVGAGSIFLNKSLHGKRHFASAHARVGLAALVVTAAAPVLGALAFKSWGLMQRLLGGGGVSCDERAVARRVAAAKRAHRAVGAASYFLSVVAIQLALGHRAVRRAWITPIWRLMALAAAGGMAGALALGTGPAAAAAAGGGERSGGGGGGSGGGGSAGGGGAAAAAAGAGGSDAGEGGESELTGIKAV